MQVNPVNYFEITEYILGGFVKSQNSLFPVIPVQTGIQSFKECTWTLDTRVRGYDDFFMNAPSAIHGFSAHGFIP
jgi:hypothetical protein